MGLFRLQFDEAKVDQRIIYLDGKVYPPNNEQNYIKNQKYTLLNFVPMVLYE